MDEEKKDGDNGDSEAEPENGKKTLASFWRDTK